MKCGARIHSQADREVNRVASLQTPLCKGERLFQRTRCLTGAADEKNPQSSDSCSFNTLGHLANFGCGKTFLELLEHGVARALSCDAKSLESGAAHRSEELR